MADYNLVPDSTIPGQQPPSFWSRLSGALPQLLGNRDLALALLANNGGLYKQSFGQVLGQSLQQADAMKQARAQQDLENQFAQARLAALRTPDRKPIAVLGPDGKTPMFVSESDAIGKQPVPSRENNIPSSWQEWQMFNQLPPADQARYLQMKRAQQFKVDDVAGVPTVVTIGAGDTPNAPNASAAPLTTFQKQTGAIAEQQRQKSINEGLGSAQGKIAGDIQTKGANSQLVTGALDEADKLIDQSTGSAGGALVDATAGLVGKSTEGSKAIARLKVLQTTLMLNMPRMEGPQSDRDVQLYRDAAGQIADPTVPRDQRRAALDQIRTLQDRYSQRAQDVNAPGAVGVPTQRSAPRIQAPPEAVAYLKQHPELSGQFKAKYGYLP